MITLVKEAFYGPRGPYTVLGLLIFLGSVFSAGVLHYWKTSQPGDPVVAWFGLPDPSKTSVITPPAPKGRPVEETKTREPGFDYKKLPGPLAAKAQARLKAAYFDLEAIRANGIVPDLTFTYLPKDMRLVGPVQDKKDLFISIVLPLVLKENEAVLSDRQKLLALMEKRHKEPLKAQELRWLHKLKTRYRVNKPLSMGGLEVLKTRVDVVPPALAVAQSIEESGWGTSRFALVGNALFGQWTWSSTNVLAPGERQTGKGQYGIKTFPSLQDSVRGYMLNLNRHAAYEDLRARRASMRSEGKPLSGYELARSLTRYSQRGAAYVTSLHGLMNTNDLQPFDKATLAGSVSSEG